MGMTTCALSLPAGPNGRSKGTPGATPRALAVDPIRLIHQGSAPRSPPSTLDPPCEHMAACSERVRAHAPVRHPVRAQLGPSRSMGSACGEARDWRDRSGSALSRRLRGGTAAHLRALDRDQLVSTLSPTNAAGPASPSMNVEQQVAACASGSSMMMSKPPSTPAALGRRASWSQFISSAATKQAQNKFAPRCSSATHPSATHLPPVDSKLPPRWLRCEWRSCR